jgi:uncharacterized protein (DUF58 family)
MPTPAALAVFVGALGAMAAGIATASATGTSLGATTLIGLAAAFAATAPLGRRVRWQRVEFAWWLAQGDPGTSGGAVVPGKPFEVRCFVRHRSASGLALHDLVPIAPGGARVEGESLASIELPAHSRGDFSFRLVAPAVGRVVLHGLAVKVAGPLGLFEVPLYFPNPLAIRVLPQAAARGATVPRTISGLPIERSGSALRRPKGSGSELRELRELRPGDPFKSIAWKASSRVGKLLVREVEQEVQQSRYVILDVSGTMRGGELGERKLDFAVEVAAAEAKRAIEDGDRVGLITVDGRMVAHVPPADGRPHLLKVFEALLDSIEAVDEDLTEPDDDEVAAIVGRYVRQQDGLDFARRDGTWNVGLLTRHALEAIGQPSPRDRIRASSGAGAALRRFCRERGLPLPYRPDPRDGAKAPGLAGALHEAGGRSRAPISVVVLTDLDGVGDPEALLAACKLLRLHGHSVSLVVPDATTFVSVPADPLERDVYSVYARAERRRFEEARSSFGPIGVPVLRASADDNPALVLMRARSGTRRAA